MKCSHYKIQGRDEITHDLRFISASPALLPKKDSDGGLWAGGFDNPLATLHLVIFWTPASAIMTAASAVAWAAFAASQKA